MIEMLLQDMRRAYQAIDSLSATVRISQGEPGEERVDGGKFRFKRPRYAYMEIGQPPNLVFACDGQNVYRVMMGARQYQQSVPGSGRLGIVPQELAGCFFGSGIEAPGGGPFFEGGVTELNGKPCTVISCRWQDGLYSWLVGPDNLVHAFRRQTREGGKVRNYQIAIEDLRIDEDLGGDSFRFDPPAGFSLWGIENLEKSLIAVGSAAPHFVIPDVRGGTIDLAEAIEKHRAVLLNVWFCDCGACHAEFPELEALYKRLRRSGLEVIAINFGDGRDRVLRVIQDSGLSFRVGLNAEAGEDYGVVRAYGVQGFPTNYLIDSAGKILYRSASWDEPGISAALARIGIDLPPAAAADAGTDDRS